MSIRKRLNEKRGRLGLGRKKWAAAATGVFLTETNGDQLLTAIKAATEKIAGLDLSDQCKAALIQLLIGLHTDNNEQIKDALAVIRADFIAKTEAVEAIPDYGTCELTSAEKNLIAVYRKAAQPDKSVIDRVAQLLEKAAENEAKSGIAEDVIDGE